MFVSTAPCGDARIFSLHEEGGGSGGRGQERQEGGSNKGKLRSKIESGMGTVPLPEEKRCVQAVSNIHL